MSIALYSAAFLALVIGIAHSVLGERYILIRLFRREGIPKLFGGTEFTTRTLRFAWHVTTIAWWGFGGLLVVLARGEPTAQAVAHVIVATFAATACVACVGSRGRHLAWIVFGLIAALTYFAVPN